MLCSRFYCSTTTGSTSVEPVLVFLHGLLGSGRDWSKTALFLAPYSQLWIDLPGHGGSQSLLCDDFDECCAHISATVLKQLGEKTPIVLVGYSLGGRLAMYGVAMQRFSALNIQGLIVEGGNFGLQSSFEREQRLKNDHHWAHRFQTEQIERVLVDWYHQPVFSSLNHEQRQTLVTQRSANLGAAVAHMLLSTSLAKQPYLLAQLEQVALPIVYVCGEKDSKFVQLAQQSGFEYRQVQAAGHNVHYEQPEVFAHLIQEFISQC
ncbi:2-succinyl-6-hydroxy-2,4-cyclohexadiene-1-carboxylate synthase [Vibrio anguillarum]|uniref:2-succinyl-6-hydroxy-2, 4-cyclohexadiene-1-carboxylate synthase n=1 Tax=Vibrio anguillarum TaxID=55601 RepID=UPI00097E1749|nr:2-succinyl-6-hydroxy-2,4-cyclohexadiene-1-carboxylate synthase [Vibrio anguillarum]MBF4284412.1 2-succinyl-6-hydroxy-2,4-cyclohexadiene-1-carboxylate synthase [Vibrio anguillarum]MBF4289505.1 2-succinyl-6-hydroxy-2,4-cyclohexadiene-1-carboxylate synthase [Vibrio anguillarum]MBF4341914.1 2-succinyl-6-hydroxy-2,4-cyclohexadiene-1-carboxylate synthase [Vibrio anguillarum]MBF4357512.1 2-succinyl-6-hydroxy-2,4-cyclohexadiene-1-carboxylate synthase [Vibrio anguillarum]MBF4379003.1 2-succinyl-6-hy